MNTDTPPKLTKLPAWQALAAHHRAQAFDLAALFAADTRRVELFSARCGNVLLDYSKQLLNADTLRLLLALARERDLGGAIARLFAGDKVNASENRTAQHMALRAASPVMLGGRDVTIDVKRELERMRAFVDAVRGERQITDVVHIGIGGSYLGPAFAGEALAPYADGALRVHYLSTVDGAALQRLVATLSAPHTLVIVASKTFTTAETMANARRSGLAGVPAGQRTSRTRAICRRDRAS